VLSVADMIVAEICHKRLVELSGKVHPLLASLRTEVWSSQ
jgi:hypothetical protein